MENQQDQQQNKDTKQFTLQAFKECNQCKVNNFENGKYILIETLEQLNDLLPVLLKNTKISIDTEQSFAKTYEGFLCLIQISTEDEDYLIDVHQINNRDGVNKALSQIFYAGQQDILWLKRDFNLNIVNYFDVKEFATFLDKSEDNSLIYLLKKYCNYELEKQKKKELQISEWSNRPLTKQQLDYAALDSHYLIKIRYELLCQSLQSVGFKRTLDVLNQMQQQTLKKYEKKKFDGQYFFDLFQKQFKHCDEVSSFIDNDSEQYKIMNTIYLRLAKFKDEYAQKYNKNANNLLQETQLFQIVSKIYDASQRKFVLITDEMDMTQYNNPSYADSKEFLQSQQKNIIQALNQWINNEERVSLLQEFNKYQQKKQNGNIHKLERKEKRTQKFEQQFCLKKEPYGNCQILSPQGLKLCNCDEKKVKWYVSRGLATIVGENPTVIKLNFQPNGKPHEELENEIGLNENQFYAQTREIVCVVCGKDEKFTKYHIIPSIFRTHFPNKFKSHRSHDIILLCVKCHMKAGKHSDILKDQLFTKYKIDRQHFFKQTSSKHLLTKINLGIKAYINNKDKMQTDQKQKCKSTIRESLEQLLSIPNIADKYQDLKEKEFKKTRNGQIKINLELKTFFNKIQKETQKQKDDDQVNEMEWFGQKVIEQLTTEDDIIEFIKLWRQHFLDVLQPKFLPFGWNVNHKFDRQFGQESVFRNEQNENQNSPKQQPAVQDN